MRENEASPRPLNLNFTAPLSWRIEKGFRVSIYDARGNQVLEISRHAKSERECEQLAELIIRAVNSHKAAREMADSLGKYPKIIGSRRGGVQQVEMPEAAFDYFRDIAWKFQEMNRESS